MEISEVVFEFVVDYIRCNGVNTIPSPLFVSFDSCNDFTLVPKQSTACKLTYQKGKRITTVLDALRDMRVSIQLLNGHGNSSVRASSTFELTEVIDLDRPAVYSLEIGLDEPEGSRFGVLKCSMQVLNQTEFVSINENRAAARQKMVKTSRITVRPSTARRDSRTDVPRLKIPPVSSRSSTSMQDRGLSQDERWTGIRHSIRIHERPSSQIRSSRSNKSTIWLLKHVWSSPFILLFLHCKAFRVLLFLSMSTMIVTIWLCWI